MHNVANRAAPLASCHAFDLTSQHAVKRMLSQKQSPYAHGESGANSILFYATDSFIERSYNLWRLGSKSVNDYGLDKANQKLELYIRI